jgi:hypothetical protein
MTKTSGARRFGIEWSPASALWCQLEHHNLDTHHSDTLAERSKAVAQGAIPKGRGFEPHRCHFAHTDRLARITYDPVLQLTRLCKRTPVGAQAAACSGTATDAWCDEAFSFECKA